MGSNNFMRILVTGGSGFIGSHLVEELLEAGHSVASLDYRDPQTPLPAGVEDFRADFCEWDALDRAFSSFQPEAVCHLGAIPSVQKSILDPMPTMRSGVTGTYLVLEASRRHGARRVVFASSGAVFGATGAEYAGRPLTEDLPLKPLNPYGLSKKMGEEMMRLWASREIWNGSDTVSLRFFNVFGPRQRRDAAYATCIERFLYQWGAGDPFTIVPDGKQRRDMVFVKDIVRAVRLAAESGHRFNGEVINIGSGKNYSILQIADIIGGSSHPRVFIEPRPGEVRETLADISKAKQLLGWEPQISFPEGTEILKRDFSEVTPPKNE